MNSTSLNTVTAPTGKIPVSESAPEAFVPNLSVWLVDDNDAFRSTLANVLGRQRGIQCARDFSSPDAVLSALASQVGPDVILLDVQMRDRNGLDAIGSIKALSRETQVLMLTSSYDPDGYQRALAEGASDFLLKSYTPAEIAQRIRNPKRRVNARPCRRQAAAQSGAKGRTSGAASPRPPSLFRGGLRFFRTLIG